MLSSPERPKGFRYPTAVIAHAVCLYHRFTLSDRGVQELLFERGVDVSHETVRNGCQRFGPECVQGLRHRAPQHGRTWHLDEIRVLLGGRAHWLWRAINEHGEVLDVLLQGHRNAGAARRFFQRLLDEHPLPEWIITDKLWSDGAALRTLPELAGVPHLRVRVGTRLNNLIEQSHRSTRAQERQQRCFRDVHRTQHFLIAHARLANLFRLTRARTPAHQRRVHLTAGFAVWTEITQQIA